jgi:hypothetical protein
MKMILKSSGMRQRLNTLLAAGSTDVRVAGFKVQAGVPMEGTFSVEPVIPEEAAKQ